MGMTFQSILAYGASPVFQTFVSEGQVTDAVFSFKLSSSGAKLYIGGSNSALYTGDFTYTPVTQQVGWNFDALGHTLTLVIQGYWQVNMDNVQGNGQTILRNVDSIIDTGATLIVGTPSQVSTLYSTLGGKAAPSSISSGFYTCKSGPKCHVCSIDTL